MAQTGYTPISLYYSTTASQAPTAGNLANGELAINITDGKLYYKDNLGAVKVIAGSGGTGIVAGSNTQIQFNNNGVFGASSGMTWDGTNLTASQLRSSGLTSGRVTYAGASGLLTDSANLTFNGTTLSLTGLNNTGNTTLGDAAADSLTVNATITSNLIFTDNTYDIGASGATRPRTGYFGTSVVAPTFIMSNLTSGRVVYTTTSGQLTDSANLLYSGTDLTVYGITVGRGAGAVSTNTAVGSSALINNSTGVQNTAIGYQAGYVITTGGYNTAVGASIMDQTAGVTGQENTAIGRVNMRPLTSGSFNTAAGNAALSALTTGSNNAAVGYQALTSNTTASENTAIGYQAAYSNTTGTKLAAGGFQALYANTTGINNTAFGYKALTANTTANFNTAVGDRALNTNTTGADNTSLGYAALYFNSTGASNTAVGSSALFNNTANNNTAVGYQAGFSNTTGRILAVGFQALYSNTTGYANHAVGSGALYTNTTGNNNIAFGGTNAVDFGAALALNTTGSQNIAIGVGAMNANTTGGNNTAIGYAALTSNTTAQNNTAVGYQALYLSNATGNTALGHTAGDALTTGGFNTMLGYLAGTNATTGTYNTFVGTGSGLNVTSGNKNTILGCYDGNQGGLDIRTAANYIVLSDGDGNPRMWANGSTWNNPGAMAVGNIVAYQQYSQSFSVGTTQWIRLCRLGSPGSMRIKYFLGSGNSEEYGEVFINTTYVTSNNQITVSRQSYNSHLLEVRLVSSTGGAPYDVFFNIRSSSLAPRIDWTPFDVRTDYGFTVYNDTTTPGAASSSLVLETGSGTVSNIVATNGLYGAYGGGVQFPASGIITTQPNTLDDYEEGTWTPVFQSDGGTTGTTTVTNRWGRYVKIGQQVTVTFGFDGSLSGFTGVLFVGGTPFTAISDSTYQFGGAFEMASSTATGSDGSNFMFFAYSTALYPRFTTGQQCGYLLVGSTQVNGVTRMCGSMTYLTAS